MSELSNNGTPSRERVTDTFRNLSFATGFYASVLREKISEGRFGSGAALALLAATGCAQEEVVKPEADRSESADHQGGAAKQSDIDCDFDLQTLLKPGIRICPDGCLPIDPKKSLPGYNFDDFEDIQKLVTLSELEREESLRRSLAPDHYQALGQAAIVTLAMNYSLIHDIALRFEVRHGLERYVSQDPDSSSPPDKDTVELVRSTIFSLDSHSEQERGLSTSNQTAGTPLRSQVVREGYGDIVTDAISHLSEQKDIEICPGECISIGENTIATLPENQASVELKVKNLIDVAEYELTKNGRSCESESLRKMGQAAVATLTSWYDRIESEDQQTTVRHAFEKYIISRSSRRDATTLTNLLEQFPFSFDVLLEAGEEANTVLVARFSDEMRELVHAFLDEDPGNPMYEMHRDWVQNRLLQIFSQNPHEYSDLLIQLATDSNIPVRFVEGYELQPPLQKARGVRAAAMIRVIEALDVLGNSEADPHSEPFSSLAETAAQFLSDNGTAAQTVPYLGRSAIVTKLSRSQAPIQRPDLFWAPVEEYFVGTSYDSNAKKLLRKMEEARNDSETG